ncbi:protein lava lamp-like: PROVISIONAL [Gigaspora margarita]|uniref:Protein lava lamp-like: PROVISIONAL n=1 Tax=Gigaspora margarita TaxID=4874 RepID=A0A8H4EJN3_GIGMA|nr:protein lava lamp-like: PROVISIONAL [Gigaspora margarita]
MYIFFVIHIHFLHDTYIFFFVILVNSIEHSIYFNNNDANNDISMALAELDDTFFVENSSSESDQNISDNEIKSESDNDKNFDDNSNTTYLSNFEYIDNSNNYIEDRVYDDLKLNVRELFKKGKCTCRSKCLEKIGYEWFLAMPYRV